MRNFRYWLIRKLAGKDGVMLNLDRGRVRNGNALIADCWFGGSAVDGS